MRFLMKADWLTVPSLSTAHGRRTKNEEMVDWFATQGPKIFEAWRLADAL